MKIAKLQGMPHYRSQVKQMKLFDENVAGNENSPIQITKQFSKAAQSSKTVSD